MTGFKHILFYLFTTLVLGLGIWGYLLLKNSKKSDVDPKEHIPIEANCVVMTSHPKELVNKLIRQNLIWKSLDSLPNIIHLNKSLLALDSIFLSNEEVLEVLDGHEMYLALDGISPLWMTSVQEQKYEKLILNFLETHFNSKKDMSGQVFELAINKNIIWYITCEKGLLAASQDVSLLLSSLNLDKTKSLAHVTSYHQLLELDNDESFKIYKKVNTYFSDLFHTGEFMYNAELQPNSITLNGYGTFAKDEIVNELIHQAPQKMNALDYLPENTIRFRSFLMDDAKSFMKKNKQEFQKQALWKSLNDSALYSIQDEHYDNLDGENVEACFKNNHAEESQLVLLKIKDQEKAETLLKYMSDSMKVYQDENGIPYKTYRLNSKNVLCSKENLKGWQAIIVSDYMAITDDLMDYIHHLSTHQTLGKNPVFMNYAKQNLLGENNEVFYENPSLSDKSETAEFGVVRKNLSHISYTVSRYKSWFQVRLRFQYKELSSSVLHEFSLWAAHADTVIRTSVYPFKNHLTGENELVFQDEKNQLYLMSATGSVLWKKRINEPIRSAIYTVDVFHNNKNQLFFNTDHELHLIDRNGNEVQGYPVRLPAKATSPMTLLDYDLQDKDYRILIACADKRIYNYTLYGVKTEGFSPVKVEDEVNLPVQYIKVAGSDYLITIDSEGKIYVFSRKGEGRIGLLNRAISHLRNFHLEAGSSIQNTKLIYVDDKSNMICKITLDDKKEVIKLDNSISDFNSVYDFVNDDHQTDVILFGDGALVAYDLFGTKLKEYFANASLIQDVQVFGKEDEERWYLFDETNKKLIVLDENAKVVRMIPDVDRRALIIRLFNDQAVYVISVNGNQVVCGK